MVKFKSLSKKMTEERIIEECMYRHGNKQCHIPIHLCEYEKKCSIWVKEVI